MAREDPQIKLRLPAELKDAIEASAARLGRSMNAEIVARLTQSEDDLTALDLALDGLQKLKLEKARLEEELKALQRKVDDGDGQGWLVAKLHHDIAVSEFERLRLRRVAHQAANELRFAAHAVRNHRAHESDATGWLDTADYVSREAGMDAADELEKKLADVRTAQGRMDEALHARVQRDQGARASGDLELQLPIAMSTADVGKDLASSFKSRRASASRLAVLEEIERGYSVRAVAAQRRIGEALDALDAARAGGDEKAIAEATSHYMQIKGALEYLDERVASLKAEIRSLRESR